MHLHAALGKYESNTAAEYVPYVVPQEHGNHFDARALRFEQGLRVDSNDRFEFCVSQYSTEALAKTAHAAELRPDGLTHLRIDYRDSGLGSNSCGPDLRDDYALRERSISWSFFLG